MNTLFGESFSKIGWNPNEIIHALWLNQPFASLMLPPFYKDETRGRKTNVRGKVLICACKKMYNSEQINEIAGSEQYWRIYKTGIIDYIQDFDNENLLGHAIGIGELVDCYPMKKEHEDKCYVQFIEPGLVYKKNEKGAIIGTKVNPMIWVWKFANVQKIEPFQIQGKQGWSILDKETIAKIKIIK